MSWAKYPIEALERGETVSFRPSGNSMTPRIKSGQLVTVEPLSESDEGYKLNVGDVVLCKVSGRHYLHLVSAIDSRGRYQISNNKGRVNGWISIQNIYGVLVSVED